jgi:hypothetical protein
VWIEPVIAQLMMIFAMVRFSPYSAYASALMATFIPEAR